MTAPATRVFDAEWYADVRPADFPPFNPHLHPFVLHHVRDVRSLMETALSMEVVA